MAIYNFNKMEQYSSPQLPDSRSDADQLNPIQSAYHHDNPDLAQAEALAMESIRVAGAWVTIFPRTEDGKYDNVWMEDSDPTYYVGVDFKAWFKPEPPQVVLTKFGHDSPNKLVLKFSRAEILRTMGERIIRIGDVIIVPHNSLVIKAKRYRVTHVADDGNYRYRWMYLAVTCENINQDEAFDPKAA